MTFDSSGLSGKLENLLGQELRNAVIYVNRHSYALGNVKDGKMEVSVGEDQSLGKDEFTSGGVVVDKLRNEFLQNLITIPDLGVKIQSTPLVIGYIDGSIVYSHIEAGHRSMLEHSLKHIEIEIEEIKYEREKDNTREMEHNS